MTKLWTGIKWLSGVIGTIVVGYIAVETWVIGKAVTVVEPVKIEVGGVSKRQDDLVQVMDSRMNSIDSKLNILIERSK